MAGGVSDAVLREVSVGDRVADKDGNVGTVAYVGPVATSKSPDTVYYGIVWDDSSRGKNDGSVVDSEGVQHRYFHCEEGGGSFLKRKLVDVGVEMVMALQGRYHDSAGGNDGSVMEAAEGQSVEIEFVGDEKIRSQQRLERLRTASLVRTRVSWVSVEALRAQAPLLGDLDLRDNLLSRWEDVGHLASALPHLTHLNIGNNKMRPFLPSSHLPLLHFPSLRVLVLSATGISFPHAAQIAAQLPTLEELHICDNNLDTLQIHEDGEEGEGGGGGGGGGEGEEEVHLTAESVATCFPTLHTLSLNGNKFSDWKALWGLRFLRRLRRLLLNDNPLPSISYAPSLADQPLPIEDPSLPLHQVSINAATSTIQNTLSPPPTSTSSATATPTLWFENLEALSIRNCQLSSWGAVDALALFPRLQWLQMQGCPVLSAGEGVLPRVRQEVIARLPQLKNLNHSEVRKREREDAEKAYVTAILREERRKMEESGGDGGGEGAEGAGKGVGKSDAQVVFGEEAGSAVGKLASAWIEAVQEEEKGGETSVGRKGGVGEWKGEEFSPIVVRLDQSHPRFFPLIVRLKFEETHVARPEMRSTLASSVVSLSIKSMAGGSSTMEPLQRKLPLTMTVQALKQLAARAFRMEDVTLVRLAFREDPKDASIPPLPLDDDLKNLSFFGVADGGQVLVEELDRRDVAAALAAEQDAHEDRMREQEESAAAIARAARSGAATGGGRG